ncbi:hypothetical protein A2797_00785 [candidate division WWE3 bacterium RIFCSPHIGHO2_01_FULL_48_15]|uniref:Nucleoside 2-deoxyribosyltransferase n=1 Tax=candidate division WWE3 bacterium RIFCSPHIGHO2_01_FULL_48_15 TaxID=1802619 RepID=A0A1F4VDM7_UNCKA|nr:MAG: hypothetical protein A2797_00785 [candidate division WWE3 bacterium RIFCSPHIGHO2_01_FULL_48_15]
MSKIFIICPVRNASEESNAYIRGYVERLEERGHKVHWPMRDTKQDDPTGGLMVCRDNFEAILAADEVHIFWDPESRGSRFDGGMLFALLRLGYRKKIVFINDVRPTPGKSFENIFLAIAGGFDLSR